MFRARFVIAFETMVGFYVGKHISFIAIVSRGDIYTYFIQQENC